MAVAFGSGGTYLTYGSRTNSTLVAPSGIANGDLLIAYLFTGAGGSSPTPTPPGGWSTLTGSPTSVNDGSFFGKYSIFYKIAASESGNYTFTHSAASSCGVVARYTGVDTSTPFSPTPTTNTGTAAIDDLATATGFTTTVANTFIIFTEHDWGTNTNDTVVPTGTTPTFTERLDATLLYIADGTLATAGATGNKSHTCNNLATNPDRWAAYLIGLNPAAGGGGAPVTLSANPGSYALTVGGRETINIGVAPNDGTGDPVRTAFRKCNQNFIALYTADTTFLTPALAATTYQPLDGDLTALAALAGTNTIYYRSAANTWSGVTIGTGLSFSAGTLSSSSITTINVQKFTASGIYTPTAGLKYCIIECVGGGGGGGGVTGNAAIVGTGGGGGSGGYSRRTVAAATIGVSQSVTIGAGGTGVTNAVGGNGNATSVGSLCVANGGFGGAINNNWAGQGANTTGAVGDITAAGAPGQSGSWTATSGASATGMGGSSFFGGGGTPTQTNAGQTFNGNTGNNYGAGGSGGSTNQVAVNGAGGSGSAGIVIITEFI